MYVTLDSVGNVYGTTGYGGDPACYAPANGCGVVFELMQVQGTWEEKILHTFTGGSDGRFAGEPVVFGPAGDLYGVTSSGGPLSAGVVFRLAPTGKGPWTESVLYAFKGGTDGGGPETNLLIDPTGGLIGVTDFGGDLSECHTNDNGFGCGVVFDVHR
jgi:uncharacterized repeat protein (TIGR03803 family)